jgi:hypothetical protein
MEAVNCPGCGEPSDSIVDGTFSCQNLKCRVLGFLFSAIDQKG